MWEGGFCAGFKNQGDAAAMARPNRMHRLRACFAAAAIAICGAGLLTAAMAGLGATPAKALFRTTCEPIDFRYVELDHDGRGRLILAIAGDRPFANMEVELRHGPSSFRGRWIVRVVGCLNSGLGLPIATAYSVSVPVAAMQGARRVTIVGASRSVQKRLPRS